MFAPLAVVGTIAGVVGWSLIRRRAADPRRVLERLVPTMFVLSLIPDLVVGVTGFLPGTGWIGVAGLATMHVVVTLSVVAACQWRLPVEHQPHDASSRHAREMLDPDTPNGQKDR